MPAQRARLLRVCPRTVRNWEAGRTRIPYAAFKPMRLLRGFELPGDAWRGWRLIGDTLWSPEGHGFRAGDHAWWSLLVRQAAAFRRQVARPRGPQPAPVAQPEAARPAAEGEPLRLPAEAAPARSCILRAGNACLA
ncbi:MAG: VC1465 family Xer recombination activation factor [Rehaibacterium terrae]|uniref:VC1465 family Xer recombination activation factor n=1 Tax=Rehaibacterium terrae TaxID=1341696 RepID=UPI00391917FA